jgi:two-component system, sensor histidine kinase
VTDSGPGLTLEQQQELFQEGVQFNANELQGGQGSGLGLWITREIVSQHHGTITGQSEGLTKGSTFEVTLPVVLYEPPMPSKGTNVMTPRHPNRDGQRTAQSAGQSQSSSLVSCFDAREHHVLVVDDAGSNRKLVCQLLRKKGYICHEAVDGKECVEMMLAGEHLYEFILLDYEMPVMDGPTAARRLREKKCDILIIGVTGNVQPEYQEHFIKHGANVVLAKPLDINRLMEEVATRHTA